jgi:hypothetical protein
MNRTPFTAAEIEEIGTGFTVAELQELANTPLHKQAAMRRTIRARRVA